MAKLIVLNDARKEILINADQIEYLYRREITAGKAVTEIRMVNGNIHQVKELPDQILGLSR